MTMIPGKDAPLADSILHMKTRLQALGFEVEESQWLNPLPHVWSVRINECNHPQLFSYGKGASRDAALASALGEFFERLSCNYFFADYYLGRAVASDVFVHYPNERWFPVAGNALPEGLLDEPTLLHYNMDGELKAPMLVDTNSGDRARGICAIPFERQRTGDQVWIPVNIIGNLYANNGIAAGNTVNEARVQALSEIFERHIKNTIISSGISLPDIPLQVQSRFPATVEVLDALRSQGYVVLVKDASLGGKFPLVNVSLINPQDGGCFASFGAHPKFEVAFERAVTELLQGRKLDQLDGFPLPGFDITDVADQDNLEAHFIDSTGAVAWDLFSTETDYQFTEWNIEGDTQAEFNQLCHLIHKVDMDIYIADFEHLGVYSCRIIVPGMSEVFPVDELVWNNNNAGIDLRQPLLRLPALTEKEAGSLLIKLEEGGFADQQRVADIIGILSDPLTAWSTLRVGELKCLLNLKLGELQEALSWSDWIQRSDYTQGEQAVLYRCLHQCLSFRLDADRSLDQYRGLLDQIYGTERVDSVLEMIDGHGVFSGLPESTLALEGFVQHHNLLSAYTRVQQAKRLI
ncbi:30S ribosomal protein S12 methylthiotransferase accessory factor YcaO [uncultured Amphritea sp.]|uniref:30S ribosomal protein S12 methylthiotransferase accessory factor YcaO n=1 Tax=uncultured Amphritea sp. TaxID=981605 RepID=UPI0025DD26A0|nr:30S ribosomal protein S12 methylthiotransferase accessory factor YcaO [uncultured Amphritea sp.]